MRSRSKVLCLLLAAVLAVICIDAAAARHKKRHSVTQHTSYHQPSAFWSGLVPMDRNGNPAIVKGYRPPAAGRPEEQPREHASRQVRIPRGSSSFIDIPPVNPAPNAANSPPPAALTHPTVQPYNPPPITTFSDRVTNAIHAYPLQHGIGNNPNDMQSFIRQRANQ